MQKKSGLALFGVALALGCSQNGERVKISYDAGTDGGSNSLDAGSAFTVTVLDTDAPGTTSIAIASSESKVGVAYVVPLANGSTDAGMYEVRYVEPGSQPQKVATLHTGYDYGVSLAFTAAGTPVVGYLGGASNNGTYWYESDMALASPNGGGVWSVTLAAQDGLGYFAGNVVGLNSSIAAAPSGDIYAAYRDVHRGQFPNQDYEHSCLDFAVGRLNGTFTQTGASDCTETQGGLEGFGANNSLTLGEGAEPAIASNIMSAGTNDVAAQLYFTHRKNGTFSAMKRLDTSIPIADAKRGPSLSYNSEGTYGFPTGYGIAVEDRTKQTVYYYRSDDGDTWDTQVNVWGSGFGGWWPSLAYDSAGAPNIAFYYCSDPGGSISQCLVHQLWLSTLIPSGDWQRQVIDPQGGYLPRLTYFNGKAAVAYKSMNSTYSDAANVLMLAIEK